MIGYKVTSLSNGYQQYFTVEAMPIALFGETEWKKIKEGYYHPWIEVEEIEIRTFAEVEGRTP